MSPLLMPPLAVLQDDGALLLVAALAVAEPLPGTRIYDCAPVWAERLSPN